MASGPTWNAQRRTWYIQYWMGKWRKKTVAKGPPTWKPGDPIPKPPPEAHAELLRLDKLERAARQGALAELPSSLADFLEDHLTSYANPRTRQTVSFAVRDFLDWCEERGITQFEQVNGRVCKAWVADTALRLTRATIETRRGYLAAAWGRLVKEEVLERNPWTFARAMGDPRVKERRSWTPEQFAALTVHCNDWLRDLLIFGANTGLRIRAILEIEWRHWIRPESEADRHGYIQVPPELDKVGRGYKVPVSPALHELLTRRESKHHPVHILCGHRGQPIKRGGQVGVSIIKACGRAGLPTPQSPNHHMRRSFGRWAVKGQLTGKPVPLYVVSRWLGHIDPKTTLKYLDLEEQESAAFMVATDPPIASSAATAMPRPATDPSPQTPDSDGEARSDG